MVSGMEIAITPSRDDQGRVLLEVVGAVDLQSRDELLRAGQSALAAAEASVIVLDLSGVSFLDSTGIGALVQIWRETEDAGLGFVVRNPSERAARVLGLTGVLDAWTVEADPDADD
jgi:anti-sigma B factor antagonist